VFRARTAENVLINVGLQWFNRLLSVVTKVILVRLLIPNDLGVFALATGLIGFVGTFGNFGLDYAIIQKSDRATSADYDVAMSLRVVSAVALFAVSILAAGPWASLFALPVVTPTTQVLALTYLIAIWSFVPSMRLTKELRYRAIAVPNITAQLGNSVISIGLAFAGFGVWALVYGLVVSTVISTTAYWIIRPWRFRLSVKGAVAAPLLRYAQHLISAATVLAFLITNIDNFTVGYFRGVTPLGFYAVAYAYGYLPVALFSSPAGSALFPSLTKIQGDLDTLRSGYIGYTATLWRSLPRHASGWSSCLQRS
jgi:PST family polysaccharide transporter